MIGANHAADEQVTKAAILIEQKYKLPAIFARPGNAAIQRLGEAFILGESHELAAALVHTDRLYQTLDIECAIVDYDEVSFFVQLPQQFQQCS